MARSHIGLNIYLIYIKHPWGDSEYQQPPGFSCKPPTELFDTRLTHGNVTCNVIYNAVDWSEIF